MRKRFWVIFFLLVIPASALWGQDLGGYAERCANPRVLARERFSLEDFFLYYPLPDSSWHVSPNVFDAEKGFPVYLPKGEDVVYYSAPDLSGSLSLYLSEERADSLWRAPRHPAEALLSSGSEVFPMLSPGGRILYFASDGLPGMGGYDIFSSTWDEANAIWGKPENLGIPYNSPSDDFLMMDTEDGNLTLFASNRSCGKDSVYVYVLEFEAFPLRTPIHDPEALEQLLSLTPTENIAASGRSAGNADTRLYMRKMAEVRSLRDSLARREKDSTLLHTLDPLRNRISVLNKEIRRIENSFLRRGAASGQDGDVPEDGQRPFSFERHSMGGPLPFTVGTPDSNYFFEISDTGAMANDNSLPEGIIYQIFMFASAQRAREDQFGGITPVYERMNSNLRYAYYAGLFPTYRLALQQLNVVRKLGFPEARIVAYSDGRSISVNQARQEE